MNITFMIGNGFDLNLGLKTKFTDFYETYFKPELDREVPESVKKFIQLVLNDKEKFGNMDKWSDFEMAFAENIEGTVDDVGEILEDFTIQFAEYLKKEEEKCDYYSDENIIMEIERFIFFSFTHLRNSIRQFIENFMINTNFVNINFINFNYTSTLENLISRIDKTGYNSLVENKHKNFNVGKILHIHGDLNSNVIIGVDRYEQFSHQIVGKKSEIEEMTVKKSINIFSREQHREIKFETLIAKSDLIYMYGLSIGKTDKNRWDMIKTWLMATPTHKLIYFAYDENLKNLNELFIQKMIKVHYKIICDVLLKLGFSQNELEDHFDQIHIIDSSAVLDFKLVDENKEPEANMN